MDKDELPAVVGRLSRWSKYEEELSPATARDLVRQVLAARHAAADAERVRELEKAVEVMGKSCEVAYDLMRDAAQPAAAEDAGQVRCANCGDFVPTAVLCTRCGHKLKPEVLPAAAADDAGAAVTEKVALRVAYTKSQPCVVEGWPDAHTVWLKVGVQEFRLMPTLETKEEAEWMREQLAKALISVVEATRKGR